MERDHDVIVVGAGLAGLAAARALSAAGASTLVLEARDRVGGRTLNHPLPGGGVVEIGGQWLGPTQDHANALARDLGLELYPTFGDGEHLFEHKGRLRRFTGTIPRLNPVILAEVGVAQARLDRMARAVPLEAPWQAPKAKTWDRMTLASWVDRNTATPTARQFFQVVAEGVFASDPGELSLLHFLFYVHSGGGIDRLISTEGGAQQDRIHGGSQLLALGLAERCGAELLLEHAVRDVRAEGDRVVVSGDGFSASAQRAIIAVPPALAGRIAYDPPLPAHRDQLTQRYAQGSVIKCMAVYDEPFWRADGLSGQVGSIDGPVKVAFDNTPRDGSPGVLLGFLEGPQARDYARVGLDERREAVVGCFARFFGTRARDFVDYFDLAWAAEPWSRGCYAGNLPPGVWTSLGDAIRSPCGPIHWAGTETATVWNGYIDGAISSGERAAAEVLSVLGSRTATVA